MKRHLMAAGLIVLLGMLGGCSKEPPAAETDTVEQAWTTMIEAYNEAETAQQKVDLFETFLSEYPDTAEAGRLASSVAYYRGTELDDPRGAYDVLAATLAKNTDPEARYRIGTALFPLAVELGEPMDLAGVAEELAATRPLTFSEMIDVADLALAHEQWAIGATYAEAALDRATPEAFLSDYPDEEYTAEEAAAKAGRRKAMGLAGLGWALWNLGETDKAMATFDEAETFKTVDYLGVADTPLDLYRGKALLAAGDAEAAIEVLTPAAVLASDADAMEALEEAFAAVNRDDELADFVWSERRRLATTVDDFTLTDYEGVSHDFSTLAKDKVTLLAFWFPT